MGQVAIRQLDMVTRIYKNSSNEVIGVHCLGIVEDRPMNPHPDYKTYPPLEERRLRTGKVNASLTTVNLTPGQSRVIDKVQMIGKYDEFTLTGTGNDLATITYLGRDEEGFVPDLTFELSALPQIGEII